MELSANSGAGISPNPITSIIAGVSVDQAVPMLADAIMERAQEDHALPGATISELVRRLGIDMHGTVVQDTVTDAPKHPDTNPGTLYIYPYARPAAGAAVMPAFIDAQGELNICMVRNYRDPLNKELGVEDVWRFPGGYMDVCAPRDVTQQHYDRNLMQAATRELREEINLSISEDKLESILVDSHYPAGGRSPNHHISAYFLADLTTAQPSANQAPPFVRAGDDVGDVAWVKLSDIQRDTSPHTFSDQPPQFHITANGTTMPFLKDHADSLEIGMKRMEQRKVQQNQSASASPETIISQGGGNLLAMHQPPPSSRHH